ncbi:MAG: phage portal protein family protein [Bacteroidota bacterium]
MAEVKKEKTENITITMTELVLQNVDRSRADLRKWWRSLQQAELISYPNRSPLYDLYERAVLDGHLKGLMSKKYKAVLNKKFHYEIKGKRVEAMDDIIRSARFRAMMRRLLESKGWGLTGLEFIPGSKLSFVNIPRKHIKPEYKVISIEQNGFEGYDYTKQPFIHVVEDEERFGLLLSSVPYTILKSGSLSDLAQYIELYGQPIRKGTYPGDDPEAKAELKSALKEAGASFSVILPEGTNIEIIGDHVTAGNGQAHEVLFSQVNNELSILWLGNTETTSNDNGGSNAKSQEHSKQQKEIHKSDIIDLEDMLSDDHLQMILKSYGMPLDPEHGKFVAEREFDLEELGKRLKIDTVVSTKVPVSDDYWYTTYGIPKPENYEELKAQMEEERRMKLQPLPANDPPPKPKPKKKDKPKPLNDDGLSKWDKMRLWLADFFGPGHKA